MNELNKLSIEELTILHGVLGLTVEINNGEITCATYEEVATDET